MILKSTEKFRYLTANSFEIIDIFRIADIIRFRWSILKLTSKMVIRKQ